MSCCCTPCAASCKLLATNDDRKSKQSHQLPISRAWPYPLLVEGEWWSGVVVLVNWCGVARHVLPKLPRFPPVAPVVCIPVSNGARRVSTRSMDPMDPWPALSPLTAHPTPHQQSKRGRERHIQDTNRGLRLSPGPWRRGVEALAGQSLIEREAKRRREQSGERGGPSYAARRNLSQLLSWSEKRQRGWQRKTAVQRERERQRQRQRQTPPTRSQVCVRAGERWGCSIDCQ